MKESELFCPHCSAVLERWEPSSYTGWAYDLFFL